MITKNHSFILVIPAILSPLIYSNSLLVLPQQCPEMENLSILEKIIHSTLAVRLESHLNTYSSVASGLALKMHPFSYIPSNPYGYMTRPFTSIFLILLLTIVAGQAFGENPIKYPGKLDIKLMDFRSIDLMSLYYPVETVGKVSHLVRLQLETDKRIENHDSSGARPILNLGSIPEVLLRYQSDTVLQWGYSFKDLILLLRFGVKTEGFNYLEFQTRRENNYLSNANLNFNFLIDFWFK